MSGGLLGSGDEYSLKLDSIPTGALQAIYHAVTGKTENLSRDLVGNVVIQCSDVHHLYQMLMEQGGQYTQEVAPTVTVVVRHANHKSVTYSSWERFINLQVQNHEVTSAIILKLEFVFSLPERRAPQRCVVSVNIDSSLPVLDGIKSRSAELEAFSLFFSTKREWETVEVSIDFVDFLTAKAFSGVVEEWFATLAQTPQKPFNDILMKNANFIRRVLGQLGRIGMAAYLAACVSIEKGRSWSLSQAISTVAVGLFIWAVIVVAESTLTPKLFKRISVNVVPSVVILTAGDQKAYNIVLSELNSPLMTITGIIATILGGVALNLAASYLYTFLTSH